MAHEEIRSEGSYYRAGLAPGTACAELCFRASAVSEVRAVECDKRFQAQLLESWKRCSMVQHAVLSSTELEVSRC